MTTNITTQHKEEDRKGETEKMTTTTTTLHKEEEKGKGSK